MKRRVKTRYRCSGAELVQTWTLIKRVVEGEVKLVEVEGVKLVLCHEDATVIAQVLLPCMSKELCDVCYKRYVKMGIAVRVLVDFRQPEKEFVREGAPKTTGKRRTR